MNYCYSAEINSSNITQCQFSKAVTYTVSQKCTNFGKL